MATLYNYFKKAPKPVVQGLPDPNRAQNQDEVVCTNVLVKQAIHDLTNTSTRKRGPYTEHDNELKTKVGRYALDHGARRAAKKFKLKKSTVENWKKLQTVLRSKPDELPEMPTPGKRGKPLKLGEELDQKLQNYLKSLRKCIQSHNSHNSHNQCC